MQRKNVVSVQPSDLKLKVSTDDAGPLPEHTIPEATSNGCPEPRDELRQCDAHEIQTKRQRKPKCNTNLNSLVETFKRRKLNVDVNEILSGCASILDMPDFPLIQTPETFFRSLCEVFEIEFPGVLNPEAVDKIVSSMKPREKT